MSSTEYEISFNNEAFIHHLEKREEGTPRSCSDPLSFASFLAFALAVSNLIMNNMKRRKRSVSCQHREWKQNSTLAASAVVTSLISSQNFDDEDCKEHIYCQTGRELSKLGLPGSFIADGTHLMGHKFYRSIQVSKWKNSMNQSKIYFSEGWVEWCSLQKMSRYENSRVQSYSWHSVLWDVGSCKIEPDRE